MKTYNRVVTFGVFDGLHQGHLFLLQEAQKYGPLTVVVTQDATVELLKGKQPLRTLEERMGMIRAVGDIVVVAGDLIQNAWGALVRYQPDCVVVGYDQDNLFQALQEYQKKSDQQFDLIRVEAHEPETMHSSILDNRGDTFIEQHRARIEEKKRRLHKGEYLADFVYGANDGIITTFAVVTGAAGASLSPGVIIILGVANLLADGFSMGASSILSTLSEKDFHKSIRLEQEYDIEHTPEIAKEEVRDVLRKWDTPKDILERMMTVLIRNKRSWADFVLREEYNITEEDTENPIHHGVATFIAFVIVGTLPLIPYLFGVRTEHQFLVSIIATAVALFTTGALQSLLTNKKWWLKTGTQMLLLGGVAAGISYGIGFFIKTVFQIAV